MRWILANEQLPNDGEFVIVAFTNNDKTIETCGGKFEFDIDGEHTWYLNNSSVHYADTFSEVIAWMKYPEWGNPFSGNPIFTRVQRELKLNQEALLGLLRGKIVQYQSYDMIMIIRNEDDLMTMTRKQYHDLMINQHDPERMMQIFREIEQ